MEKKAGQGHNEEWRNLTEGKLLSSHTPLHIGKSNLMQTYNPL